MSQEMNPTLDSLISRAEKLARAGDKQGALSLANQLVAQHPDEMKVWSLRAYLHGRERDYAGAIADLSTAIRINPMEPSLFCNRGQDHLSLGDYEATLIDCGKGLDLCDHYDNDYYRESLMCIRAEAFIGLGRRDEALADLAGVRDGLKFWTNRLRTKKEMVAECLRLPA